MLSRSALESVTHRIVVRRRLPSPFTTTRIYASSEGGLRYLRPPNKVNPSCLAHEVVQPGDSVWDIGANVGLFSFAAAVTAGPHGRVLAVEPDTTASTRPWARVNHGHAVVEVLPAAVADGLGVGRFHIARRNRSTNHLDSFGTTHTGGTRTIELVPTMTLDWLATSLPTPDIIKIDVEGAEMTVLVGASRLLRSHPTIICEVADSNAVALQELLTSYGTPCMTAKNPHRGGSRRLKLRRIPWRSSTHPFTP